MKISVAHITTVDLSLRYLLLNQLVDIREAGYDVYGISAAGTNVPAIEAAGIRHIAVPMTRSLTPAADLLSLWRLFRIMRHRRFTIVHTHNPKPGLIGQVAARLARVPIVVNTLHGFYFHEHMRPAWRRLYIFLEKIAARCSDVILSQNSEDIKTAIDERICRPEQIKYLGNGIDLTLFDRARLNGQQLLIKRQMLGLPENVPVVGFVGRLVEEKGILDLLAAMQVVRRVLPDVRLLIVGPQDQKKSDALTPAVVKDFSLTEICVFTGLRQDMPDLYAIMDVFVLPSHREGFPRSPMEASAIGVPCIVTDIRGCRETVFPDENGLLIPLGDSAACAQAILSILTDRERSSTLSRRGQSLARERFDERLVFERVKLEYATLLRASGFELPAGQMAKA
jgi:glycosyltransferase involved in cell wall biosynthesis